MPLYGPGGGGVWSWQFTPEAYGAIGNGVADDTAAVQAAWNAAVAYAGSNQGYAELLLSPKRYRMPTASFVKGAGTKGNALLPSPLVAAAAQKQILVVRGLTDEQSVLPHWNQATPQMAGAVLDASAITGQTVDATYGLPSIIGGPTPQQGYGTAGTFNNVCVRVNNVTLVSALNPTIAAMDFRGNAEATLGSVSALVASVPSTMLTTVPTSSWSTGVFMPALLNNADSVLDRVTIQGYYFGVSLGPHSRFPRLFVSYCGYGIYVPSTGSDKHGVMGWADVEECNTALTTDASAGPNTPVDMTLDVEGVGTYASLGTGYHVSDTANSLGGHIRLNDSAGAGATYAVLGAANVKIEALNQPRGPVTAPGIPASTVALRNPFWRDAAVTINGGTVSAVAVDATTLFTTTGVTVLVPSGHTVTLTYTVVPTSWTWDLI